MSIEVIVNASGGSFVEGESDDLITQEFASQGLQAEIRLARSGDEIMKFTADAAQSDATTLVASGGDGTINAVASKAFAAAKSLGVVPLGTLNHFSKDLHIPSDVPSAVGVIAAGHRQSIDIGEVNGTFFVNNSSIGLYPRIVRRRERIQERLGRGKRTAAIMATLRMLRRDPFFKVTVEVAGKSITRKTPFVFVGNNEYRMELYNIGTRERLDEGCLSVYFPRYGGRSGVLRLLLRTIFGLLRPQDEFETIKTDAVTIGVRGKRVRVAFDGEVAMMETPLHYRIHPGALSVFVPAPEENDDA